MSLIKIFSMAAAFAVIAMVACQSPNASKPAPNNETTAVDSSKQFGDPITAEGAIDYATLLEKLRTVDSMAVKVRGTVDGVCQAKGCWMNITAGKEGSEDMFVKFKDYGFFVPKDIAGQDVVMQGMAYREVTSVDELRHYAEDEGKSPEEIAAITAPKEELKFMASGVLLME